MSPERVPLLVDRYGRFSRGFMGLWRLGKRKTRQAAGVQIENELTAQIQKAIDHGIEPTHLDSHRHVHMIPFVYKIILKLAHHFGIERIRTVNERPWLTMRTSRSIGCFLSLNVAKYLLLSSFAEINRTYCVNDRSGGSALFSVLQTCRITPSMVTSIIRDPQYERFDQVEIMLHPGTPELDRQCDLDDEKERRHLVASARQQELEACRCLR